MAGAKADVVETPRADEPLMASIAECRALLGAAAEGLSDAQVNELRLDAYRFAWTLVDVYADRKR